MFSIFKKKEESVFKKYSHLWPYASLILLLGVIGQAFMLLKFNAIALFSWTNVMNDTVILAFPISFVCLGYYFGQTGKMVKGKVWLMLRAFGCLIASIVLLSIIILLFPAFNIRFIAMIIAMFVAGLLYAIFFTQKEQKISKPTAFELWFFPFILLSLAILLFLSVGWALSYFYNLYYENINICIDKIHTEKVAYMNDRYIIYGTGTIIANSPEVKILLK